MEPARHSTASFLFGYNRWAAVAQGLHIDVSAAAATEGIPCPVFITRSVYARFIVVPSGVVDQDEAQRLWAFLAMLRVALNWADRNQSRLTYYPPFYPGNNEPQYIHLGVECGIHDFDSHKPAITVYLPIED